MGSIVKNEIAPLPILDIRLNLPDLLFGLGTSPPPWVLDVSHRLDDRFPTTIARSPSIRAAVASGPPELMMLRVPLTLLMRSLLDVDTRERHIAMRTVNFGVALLQLIYRASDEAKEFRHSDKARAGAVVHVHRRDMFLILMMVEYAESRLVAQPGETYLGCGSSQSVECLWGKIAQNAHGKLCAAEARGRQNLTETPRQSRSLPRVAAAEVGLDLEFGEVASSGPRSTVHDLWPALPFAN
jgi:hypothetical protein